MTRTTAATVLDHAWAGRFDAIRELFAPELRTQVTPDTLRASWDAAVGQLGQFAAVGAEEHGQGPGIEG